MSRPKNPNNVYSLTCRVTGAEVPTNPKQFRELANRYGLSDEDMKANYVSRLGRRQITDEKLTPEQASEKYGILLSVAEALKCTVKPKAEKPAKVVVPTEMTVEVPATAETTETPESTETVSQEGGSDNPTHVFCFNPDEEDAETKESTPA